MSPTSAVDSSRRRRARRIPVLAPQADRYPEVAGQLTRAIRERGTRCRRLPHHPPTGHPRHPRRRRRHNDCARYPARIRSAITHPSSHRAPVLRRATTPDQALHRPWRPGSWPDRRSSCSQLWPMAYGMGTAPVLAALTSSPAWSLCRKPGPGRTAHHAGRRRGQCRHSASSFTACWSRLADPPPPPWAHFGADG